MPLPLTQDISAQQRQAWNEFSPGWQKWNARIQTWLGPVGAALIAAADLAESDRVLDVATGTGEPGLTAASLVKTGEVIGQDVAEDMVRIANEIAQRRGIRNYTAVAGDAAALPFTDNEFDAILCRMGVMFFSNPVADVREVIRVLKPGGKLSAAVWAEPAKNPWATTIAGVLHTMLDLAVPGPDLPGIFRFSVPGALVALLQSAGLRAVEGREVLGDLTFDSPEQYWAYMTDVAPPVTLALRAADAGTRAQVQTATRAAARGFMREGRVVFPWSAWVAWGTK